jgi:hypothetical protein
MFSGENDFSYHLGEGVQNNVPGLRVSITDKFLRNFRNQFKPFDKVFGCTMEGCFLAKMTFL